MPECAPDRLLVTLKKIAGDKNMTIRTSRCHAALLQPGAGLSTPGTGVHLFDHSHGAATKKTLGSRGVPGATLAP
jgi:hypothetical protein